jgi:hypothetical protein
MPRNDDTAEALVREGKTLQRIETPYNTAVSVQKPRNFNQFIEKVKTEASYAGESFYYRWPVKKDGKVSGYVEGGSIGMAACLARNFGNCVVNTTITEENSREWEFAADFIDLETGFTMRRLFRQRKSQNIGKKYDDARAEDMVFQIGQSKAQRNVILKAMPEWLVDECMEEAKSQELKKIQSMGLVPARDKTLQILQQKYGVEQARVLAIFGYENVEQIGADQLVELKGMIQALKEKHNTAEELFPLIEKKPEPTVEEKKAQKAEEEKAADVLPDDEPKQEKKEAPQPQAKAKEKTGEESPPQKRYNDLCEKYGRKAVNSILNSFPVPFEKMSDGEKSSALDEAEDTLGGEKEEEPKQEEGIPETHERITEMANRFGSRDKVIAVLHNLHPAFDNYSDEAKHNALDMTEKALVKKYPPKTKA